MTKKRKNKNTIRSCWKRRRRDPDKTNEEEKEEEEEEDDEAAEMEIQADGAGSMLAIGALETETFDAGSNSVRSTNRGRGHLDEEQGKVDDGSNLESGEVTAEGSPDRNNDGNPFRCMLVVDQSTPTDQQQVLMWHSPNGLIPLPVEESLLDVLLHWKSNERKMMKDQPPFRLRKVRQACHHAQVPLTTALSLRRHHIQKMNPGKSKIQLGLGKDGDINESARRFEAAIAECLDRHGVAYWNESTQREYFSKNRKEEDISPPTPDFLLHKSMVFKKFYKRRNRRTKQHCVAVWAEQSVNWIEAKMFYGASTIPLNGYGAVGGLLCTANKYVRSHGPGAMVFMHGCGDRLASQLEESQVLVLDCSSPEMVDLSDVESHQRTWCANSEGHILP